RTHLPERGMRRHLRLSESVARGTPPHRGRSDGLPHEPLTHPQHAVPRHAPPRSRGGAPPHAAIAPTTRPSHAPAPSPSPTKDPMHHAAQPASTSPVRRGGILIGALLAGALLAVPTASANSYHVDLDAPALNSNATTAVLGGGAPAGSFTRGGAFGAEIHAASGAFIPGGAWAVTGLSAPAGTYFQNSSVSWWSCAADSSGAFTSFL